MKPTNTFNNDFSSTKNTIPTPKISFMLPNKGYSSINVNVPKETTKVTQNDSRESNTTVSIGPKFTSGKRSKVHMDDPCLPEDDDFDGKISSDIHVDANSNIDIETNYSETSKTSFSVTSLYIGQNFFLDKYEPIPHSKSDNSKKLKNGLTENEEKRASLIQKKLMKALSE